MTALRQRRHGRRGDAAGRVRLPAQAVHAGPAPRRPRALSGWSAAAPPGQPPGRAGPRRARPRPTWTPRSRRAAGARRGLPGRADATPRSCSAARAAPARACWRGPSTPAAGGPARPFVTVHCPSLSAELLESDLFGHVQGAFTGAVRDTAGKVAAAEGGTLFLDEIGDLPLALQPKLLRLLQEKRLRARRRDRRPRTADVRLVAATNRDLEADVAAGPVPRGPAYRLNVIEVTLPPLRQRPRDVRRSPTPAAFLRPAGRQAGRRLHARGARGDRPAIPGRATSASCGTPSSAA